MFFLQIKTTEIFQDTEIILVPLCLILIAIVSRRGKNYFENSAIKSYYYLGLWLKMIFTFVYILTIYFYYKGGDTFIYYQAIKDIGESFKVDPTSWTQVYGKIPLNNLDHVYTYFQFDGTGVTHYYMYTPENYTVSRFGFPFSWMFGYSYICTSLCMSYFAFAGCWRMFRVFVKLYPKLQFHIAIATLFLPSLVFWGVGLVKDSISIGALGFCFYGCYHLVLGQGNKLRAVFFAIAGSFLLYIVKPYIFISFMAGFVLWVFLHYNRRIKNDTIRKFTGFFFVLVGLGSAIIVAQSITAEGSKFSADKIVEAVISQQKGFAANTSKGTSFEIQELDNSLFGLIKQFPLGVVNSLFRPFPWEVRNPFMALSALEALGFLAITLMCWVRIGIFKSYGMIFSNPDALFCFVFSVLFAGFVGLSTPNFGSLVRYKIPCLPFYLMAHFIIMTRSGKFSTQYIFDKRLF